jgi:type II secretory pathway component PulC
MSKREKAIVLLTFVAILYGVYSLLFASASENDTKGRAAGFDETCKLAIEAARNVFKDASSEIDTYIMTRAETAWKRELFLRSDSFFQSTAFPDPAGNSADEKKFIYSGFVASAEKRLAIINGVEYAQGETLNGTDYFVREISPDRVLLGLARKKTTMTVPLADAY